jgi:PBSX family phage terminase large subunit
MNIFEPHSIKQNKAILSDKRILLLSCGTQYGKTVVGAIRMKMKIHQFNEKQDNFLITAPSYKTMHQSTLPAFLNYMDDCGTYDKKFDVFRLNSGGNVYCRTETDPDSVVGITNIKHIWCDEAGKYRLYFWENIQARADFCGATIDLTTSPYSMNWIPKELINPSIAGNRPDVEYINAASWENKYHSLHDPKARQLKESTMDPRRFNMIYGGEFGQMAGLVYDCFREEHHVIDPIRLPEGTKYFGGIDWGYTDPFVILIRAITPSGHQFQVSEFYKTGLTPSEMIVAAKQKMTIFNVEKFYADPSRPEYIEAFNRERIPTIKADNNIRIGIDAHYELIQSGRFKIFKNTSPYTIDEYSGYHYPEEKDLGPDENSKEILPVDAGNHTQDCSRYLTMALRSKSIDKHAPKVPNDSMTDKIRQDHNLRIKFLKKLKKNNNGSEEFS